MAGQTTPERVRVARYTAGMRHGLILHPDSRCDAVSRIEVDVTRPYAGALLLSYQVTGAIGELRLSPIMAAARADELWRRTCFEAFIRPVPGAAYDEFNFAPSTQWAAYRFDGYRTGMRVWTEIGAPRIEVRSSPQRYTLQAALEFGVPREAGYRLGLAAVIEEANGRLSYWALAHPPGKPDFHHADCFAREI
jgi:hypothetical protein